LANSGIGTWALIDRKGKTALELMLNGIDCLSEDLWPVRVLAADLIDVWRTGSPAQLSESITD
jgi:hypothetical protein